MSLKPVILIQLIGLLILLGGSGQKMRLFSLSKHQLIQDFKRSLPSRFPVIYEKPFLVTGDLSENALQKIVSGTIRSCTRALYHDFIATRPTKPIKIYLLKNSASYKRYSQKLFKVKPETPYGYYLSSRRSMVMNISTGLGTLVHELCHPLLEEDFPEIPSWLDEGIGSLFEACSCGKHIYGYVNWRLPVLKRSIREGRYVSLRKVFSTTSEEFYEDRNDTHYGEVRYFCLYMQEKKVLRKFYKSFRRNHFRDKTGIHFVEKVFGGKKLEDIEKDWLLWVEGLRYD